MPGKDHPEPASPDVRDKRVAPSGVLPKNTQAWVLTSLALVMVAVIALSGRNAPKEKTATPTAPGPAAESNAVQIREYETQLRAEAQKLQMAKEQLSRTQQALGFTSAGTSGRAAAPSYPAQSGAPFSAPWPGTEQNRALLDAGEREEKSLFASNVALSYRTEIAQPPVPAPPSASDMVAKALSAYSPAAPALAATSAPPSSAAEAASGGAKEKPDKARAARDLGIDRADGKEYRLFEGTVIETVLTNRLDGTFSGPVNCMVTTSVYSHNGWHVLIPQGSRVLGEAKKVETLGDQRLAVFFHRLIMPDGYSVSLDKFQGLNQIGETGLQDQVNHHYLQVFGVSLALGAVAGFSQANTSYGTGESAADAYRQGAASSLAQSSAHILDRYLNVLPTITIREGHRVKVYLSNDLLLPAYEKHQMPDDL